MGVSDYAFPGATHTRFLHSVGAFALAKKIIPLLFEKNGFSPKNAEIQKLIQCAQVAVLLHDIGHAPLSHSTELVMPPLSSLKLPLFFQEGRPSRATHEDYTLAIINDESMRPFFAPLINKYNINSENISSLIFGAPHKKEFFIVQGIDFFPLLTQLVSSEVDCDRMDYLLRDSYYCGVTYGRYDLGWLIENLTLTVEENQAFLAFPRRTLLALDNFLLCRHYMFLMVYFHHKSVVYEKMLMNYLQSEDCTYRIPSDLQEYLLHDDYFFKESMKKSTNKTAKKLIQGDLPSKVMESTNGHHEYLMKSIQSFFEKENISYHYTSSRGQLSNYYLKNSSSFFPIKIVDEYVLNSTLKKQQSISEGSDLYQKFSAAHHIERLHCDIDTLTHEQNKFLYKMINR